ncbi:MAG: hypothetical protein U0T81_02080 [Saprospiraceae bacterium]
MSKIDQKKEKAEGQRIILIMVGIAGPDAFNVPGIQIRKRYIEKRRKAVVRSLD